MQSLLLNGDWEPIRVIHERAAVLLLVMDDAETIVDTDKAYHSAGGLVVPIPSVLHLVRKVKLPRRSRLPISRRNVVARDGGRCGYCGEPGTTIDHIVPRSRGGKHSWLNVVACCQPCNARKDNHLLSELGWTLKIKPSVPEGQFWILVDQLSSERPEWAPFLRQAAA